jgi:transposase
MCRNWLMNAVQEARIKYRWEALDQENEAIASAKKNKISYQPQVLSNGDTLKQLLARSRYLLFKHPIKWTEVQKRRAELLFERYPELKRAYDLSIRFRLIQNNSAKIIWKILCRKFFILN